MVHKGERVQASIEEVFPFGVFCRLQSDGSRAYIRRRELTLSGQIDPRQLYKPGDQIEVIVKNPAFNDRIAELSWRLAQPDPWPNFLKNKQIGDTLTGTVKYVHPDRVTVEVLPGVVGVINLEDLSDQPIKHPEEMVWPGDHVIASITKLDPVSKRMQLSIRQVLERGKLIGRVLDWMSTAKIDTANQFEDLETIREGHVPINYQGRIIVAEDDFEVRDALVNWLIEGGCIVDSCQNGSEALEKFDQQGYALLITDINMPGINGINLVRQLKDRFPDTVYCFLSDIDQIAFHGDEIDKLEGHIFVKPFETEEIYQFLRELSKGVLRNRDSISLKKENKNNPFDELISNARSSQGLNEKLQLLLNSLLTETNAEEAIIFHYDPLSRLISITLKAGNLPLRNDLINNLIASPVEDVITEDNVIWENRVASLRHESYKKLQEFISFESCIAVPITIGNERNHSLFLFHRQPDAFSRYRIRDAQTYAGLISLAFEHDIFQQRLRDSSTLLLNGQLSSAFNHEVYNKVSVLDLQLDMLNSAYSDLITAYPMMADSAQAKKLSNSIDKVSQAVRSLNHLADNFRRIMRGGWGEYLDPIRIIQQACEQVKPLAENSSITIIQDESENLPETRFNSFALMFVVYNLLLNAIQHLSNRKSERSIRIKVNREVIDSLNYAVIRISDSGPGIHRQLWDKIFELGYTTRSGGSGLGLYIAKSLTETYGGFVCVEESVIEGGTTFKIELPEGKISC